MAQTRRVYVPGQSEQTARPFMWELIFDAMTIHDDGRVTVVNKKKRGTTIARATIFDIQDGPAFLSVLKDRLQFATCQQELEENAKVMQIGAMTVGVVKSRTEAGVCFSLWKQDAGRAGA